MLKVFLPLTLVLISSISCTQNAPEPKTELNNGPSNPPTQITTTNPSKDVKATQEAQTDIPSAQNVLQHTDKPKDQLDSGLNTPAIPTLGDKKVDIASTDRPSPLTQNLANVDPNLPTITPEVGSESTDAISSRCAYRWLFFFMSVGVLIVLLGLVILSGYYRMYLYKKKVIPFDAPRFLRMFFPKPMNYEHEISELCSKYIGDQP